MKRTPPARAVRRPARLAATFCVAVAMCTLAPVDLGTASAAACTVTAGGAEPGTQPWAQTRLGFQRVWSVTEGAGQLVAVIDSGVDRKQPQMAALHAVTGINVIPGFNPTDTTDCIGHGTAVTGIIAAPQVAGVQFVGVAPQATILPIKQTNTENDNTGNAAGIAAGINAAVSAGARVINISVTVTTPTDDLRAAVARASAADVVIVAAAGNDGQGNNFAAYPAAFATSFDNVLAVSATDQSDSVGSFSESGKYVNIAAPGVNVEVPAPISGYVFNASGTSFATPFVTGTVALVRAAHPNLTAAQVCRRIERTADAPPATVPDSKFGFGIVDPYLAVTTIGGDSSASAAPTRAAPLPAATSTSSSSTFLQHVAIGVALALLGVAALTAAGAAARRGIHARSLR